MELIEAIAEVLKVSPDVITEDFGPKTHSSWDSLNHVQVILMLEEKYNVRFSIPEIVAVTSVASIREILIKKGVETSANEG